MENKKLKIGIDIDDTVWKYHKKFFEYCGEKLGWKERARDCTVRGLKKIYGFSTEEIQKLFDDFELSNESWEVEFLDGALESIKKLNEENELFFVTSRHGGIIELTKKKILKFLGFELPLYHVYDEKREKIKDKYEICQELGIDYLVEDSLKNVKSCAENGIKCLLIDAHWNRVEELPEGVVRVKDWKEVLEKINKEAPNGVPTGNEGKE